MDTHAFSEEQTMLALALLSYRGSLDPGVGAAHEARLRAAVARGLGELAPLGDRWELVWGPASYRAPFSTSDDALMYVARDRARPARYVVAIRGTNPISSFDWLFGDLWVGVQVPWPYGDRSGFPDAKISLSTALGLSVLQYLHSGPPSGGIVSEFWRLADAGVGTLLRGVTDWFGRAVGGGAAGRLRAIGTDLRAVVENVERARRARVGRSFAEGAAGMLRAWQSVERVRMVELVADAVDTLGEERALNLLRLLEGDARLREQLQPGVDLAGFLAAAVAHAPGEVEVIVTGHSKGGALAPTVALWLADTQGVDCVREEERWDPAKKATVRCFSFAGPTAGNVAFAARSDAVIGPDCHRIANTLDVVPHAWAVADLRKIPDLYGRERRLPVVADLVRVIAAEIEPLHYRHVGLNVTELAGVVDPTRPFVDEIVHQHLEGYLHALDLSGEMSTLTFFGPAS